MQEGRRADSPAAPISSTQGLVRSSSNERLYWYVDTHQATREMPIATNDGTWCVNHVSNECHATTITILCTSQQSTCISSIEFDRFDRYRIEGVPHVWYRSHGARVFATSCRRIARIGYLLGRLLSDRDRLRHRTGSSCRWISLADPSTRALCSEVVCCLSVNEDARS